MSHQCVRSLKNVCGLNLCKVALSISSGSTRMVSLPSRSTTTAALTMQDYINRNIEENRVVYKYSADLSAASDTFMNWLSSHQNFKLVIPSVQYVNFKGLRFLISTHGVAIMFYALSSVYLREHLLRSRAIQHLTSAIQKRLDFA